MWGDLFIKFNSIKFIWFVDIKEYIDLLKWLLVNKKYEKLTIKVNFIEFLNILRVFSFEINLEKYKKMINSPLIIIIKNIIGNKVDDFHRFIFKHKIILYINMRMIIVTGWVNVVKKILIINKSMSHIKYEIHIVFVILIYK